MKQFFQGLIYISGIVMSLGFIVNGITMILLSTSVTTNDFKSSLSLIAGFGLVVFSFIALIFIVKSYIRKLRVNKNKKAS